MRHHIFAFGCFLMVLIVIAGCTSPQPSPQSGNPGGIKTTNMEKNSGTDSLTDLNTCSRPPTDPLEFQKFFPEVPGFDRPYRNKISGLTYQNYTKYVNTDHFSNFIGEQYNSDTQYNYRIFVTFSDYGPCSDYFPFNIRHAAYEQQNSTQRKITYHGYPALYMSNLQSGSLQHTDVMVLVGVSNRLFVSIGARDFEDNVPIAEMEADIETFANSIDFKGFAGSVQG